MNKYILITAGRGPEECGLAVQGIQKKFKEYLEQENIEYEIISQKKCQTPRSMESIVFKVNTSNQKLLNPWLGSIQWNCKSPIRKYHKRKNWFIKCQRIDFVDQVEFDLKSISIQTFRASGPGGQHRNKVETAVRIVHKPTGLHVTSSDSKSQLQNKKQAMIKLEQQLNQFNKDLMLDFNSKQWANQLDIDRGNPVKTFYGKQFKEK